MSRFDYCFRIDVGNVIKYTLEKVTEIPWGRGSMETVVPFSRGNLDYVYRVWDGKRHSIHIKQAGSEAEIFKDIKPSEDGNRLESEVFILGDQCVSGVVSHVYFFDTAMCACDMGDYSNYAVVRDVMLKHGAFPRFAEDVSTFMANTLLLSSDVVVDHEEKKEPARKFISPDLCDITEKLVLMKLYVDLYDRNNMYVPNRDFVKRELYKDEALRLEVNRLKFRSMTDAQVLLHGDLHTGSIFIRQDLTKIFDCEFETYASMSYDTDNVVVNLTFTYDDGLSTDGGPFCGWCLNITKETVDLFVEKFSRKYGETVIEPMARVKGFKGWYLGGILKDTVGYADTGLYHRTVDMANIVDVITIQDKTKHLSAKRINILADKDYIMNQGSFRAGANYAVVVLRAKEAAQKAF